jgi:hypothetical protein
MIPKSLWRLLRPESQDSVKSPIHHYPLLEAFGEDPKKIASNNKNFLYQIFLTTWLLPRSFNAQFF